MNPAITHQGPRQNLPGDKLGTGWEDFLFSEQQVNQHTPPAILAHSWDDKSVPVQKAMRYSTALNEAGVQGEEQFFEKYGQGYGMGNKEMHGNAATWIILSHQWIQDNFGR